MPEVSVVIPVLNEEGSLEELHARLTAVLSAHFRKHELVFVNDGSTDGSAVLLDALAARDPSVVVIHLRKNFGKAAALDAAFLDARGKVVVTMDADLQDVPEELPRLVRKLDEGFDCVSGWKSVRRDPAGKRWPSKLFNAVVRKVSGLPIHDFNCGFKAYRAEALAGLRLYGEMHRYVPVLLHWRGFRIGEVAVEHAPRKSGVSKYGLERFARGFFDLLTVLLNTRYRSRPLHLFGYVGALLASIGGAALVYLAALWLMGERPVGNRPLLFFGMLFVMLGVQLISTGLLGELINRAQPGDSEHYFVREVKRYPEARSQATKVDRPS